MEEKKSFGVIADDGAGIKYLLSLTKWFLRIAGKRVRATTRRPINLDSDELCGVHRKYQLSVQVWLLVGGDTKRTSGWSFVASGSSIHVHCTYVYITSTTTKSGIKWSSCCLH